MRTPLSGKRIAILVEDEFRDPDVVVALRRLRAAGASVTLVGSGMRHAYRGERGTTVFADCSLNGMRTADLDAVLIPGGEASERLRQRRDVIQLLLEAHASGKVLGAFSQAVRMLIDADMLRGVAGRAEWLETDALARSLDGAADLLAHGNVIAAHDATSAEFYAALGERLGQAEGTQQPPPS
jgi:putative intracellular protease/amidase